MHQHEKMNYVEFAACDLDATKTFFQHAFNWQFTDYGSEYVAFNHQGLEGGFYLAPLAAKADQGSALIVFYSADLRKTQLKIEKSGGIINKATFTFPGGQRFHFIEPSGNEFAVWSDK